MVVDRPMILAEFCDLGIPAVDSPATLKIDLRGQHPPFPKQLHRLGLAGGVESSIRGVLADLQIMLAVPCQRGKTQRHQQLTFLRGASPGIEIVAAPSVW